MAVANISDSFIDTTNVTTNFIATMWSDEVLDALQHRLVMAPLVNTDFAYLVQGKGNAIKIPIISNLTANNKVVRTPVTVQAPGTESVVTVNIDKHKESSILVEDLAEIQNHVAIRTRYTERIGYAIAKQVDTDLIALGDNFSTVTSTSGTGNTSFLDENDIIMAKTILDQNDCPLEDRHIVIAPQMYNQLLKIERFSEYQRLGGPAVGVIPTGSLGTIHGFNVWMTQNLEATGTGTSDTCPTLVFHRDAIALCMQMQPRAQANYLAEYLGTLITVDVVYGLNNLRTAWGVKVVNDAVAVIGF